MATRLTAEEARLVPEAPPARPLVFRSANVRARVHKQQAIFDINPWLVIAFLVVLVTLVGILI